MSTRARIIIVGGDYTDADSLADKAVRKRGKCRTGTPDFRARSRKLQIPTDWQSIYL